MRGLEKEGRVKVRDLGFEEIRLDVRRDEEAAIFFFFPWG